MLAPLANLPVAFADVTVTAGAVTVLDRVSLRFEAGPPTVLIGPNGAGKTTVLRAAMGLVAPARGRISWGGGAGVAQRRAIVFQRPTMLRRSVAANVDFALKLRRVADSERPGRVAAALDATGLSPLSRQPARSLSGGEQQRLALARAWAVQPEVLFLDEPTASLDPSSARAVENIIASIHRAGTKIIMTTHDLALARRLADEIVFLHQGRLLDHQPAGAFFGFPATEEARAFLAGTLDW